MQIYDQLSLLSSSPSDSRVRYLNTGLTNRSRIRSSQQKEQDSGKATAPQSNITELVISKFCSNLEQMLLPMLSFQTRSSGDRWVTWVSDDTIDKNVLLNYGVYLDHLRMIYPKNQTDLFSLTLKALSTGNSQCVVSIFDSISEQQREELNRAAKEGNCTGILVTLRN